MPPPAANTFLVFFFFIRGQKFSETVSFNKRIKFCSTFSTLPSQLQVYMFIHSVVHYSFIQQIRKCVLRATPCRKKPLRGGVGGLRLLSSTRVTLEGRGWAQLEDPTVCVTTVRGVVS